MNEQIKPAYLGEALLLRWGESASQGRTVTLQLDEEGQIHPFKGLKAGGNGQRMKLCAVLIDDHEQPQEPDRARRSGPTKVAEKKTVEAEVQKERTYTRSQIAAMKCQDPEFQRFLLARCGEQPPERHADPAASTDHVLKIVLGITSKRELDEDLNKSEAFDRMLASFDYRDRVRA